MTTISTYDRLMQLSRSCFDQIKDERQAAKVKISLSDNIMSALGIFALKFPSLLKFDKEIRQNSDSPEAQNFYSLFGVKQAPDDTSMRQTIDQISPSEFRAPFNKIFSELSTQKVLESFQFYRGTYLIAMDGTGYFSSHDISCDNCCVKNHRDGSVTYYHQMLSAAIIHPEKIQVIPLAPEPINKQDGAKKNDCERNAAKRLLESIRKEHPKLDITITEDALSSNYPHIKELKKYDMHFILGIKPGDHKNFFERLEEDNLAGLVHDFETQDKKTTRKYRYINDIILKDNQEDLKVNYFECIETDSKGNATIFSWVTDFLVSEGNIEKLMKGGRARWRIENEVFNTLKNQGYQFEHNFGHGKKNLSTNFAMLMMLSFLIDQASELCCKAYQTARAKTRTKYTLWEAMRSIFNIFSVDSWSTLFKLIAGTIKVTYSFDSG